MVALKIIFFLRLLKDADILFNPRWETVLKQCF
jgi:hypothetical protein